MVLKPMSCLYTKEEYTEVMSVKGFDVASGIQDGESAETAAPQEERRMPNGYPNDNLHDPLMRKIYVGTDGESLFAKPTLQAHGCFFPCMKSVEGMPCAIQGEIKTAGLSVIGNCFSGPRPDSGNRFCVMPKQFSVEDHKVGMLDKEGPSTVVE